jgi:hypothetical protein
VGKKYTINDPNKLYFVTFTVVNWIDVFIQDIYKQIVIESCWGLCSRKTKFGGIDLHSVKWKVSGTLVV